MKKIYIFLIGLMMLFSLTSCETYAYATTQDDIYVETEVDIVQSNVSFDVVLRYGRPYYRDGVLLYYIYNNLYYYPYYYGNYWYVRAYRRPFPHVNYRPYFRPHKYDYRFNPNHYRMHGIYGTRLHNNYNACCLWPTSLWLLAWLIIEMVLNLTIPGVKSRGVVRLILELLLKKWFPMPKSGISYPKSHI